ncbi:MAG: ParB N-terminal domain-containing protein [Deltaproteobacteria bacterium]|nr:ParB N-terminal domain-containing protein [Deltaproteobacteria bacterium]
MPLTPYVPRIKIVPLKTCVAHEGVVAAWVTQIASSLRDEGVMKNPIIVTKAGRAGRRIVIDGMHRFAALRQLEIPDVAVYEIDYADDQITLGGWDVLTFRPFQARTFLAHHFPRCRIETTRELAVAQRTVDARTALVAARDRRQTFYLPVPPRTISVEDCVREGRRLDDALDAEGYRPVYVADTLAHADFARTQATGLLIRPHYTKQEIIQRTLAGKLFPRKSTRHMIPGRPLRVDVGMALLRAPISLAAKNRLLDEHLRWSYEADRIRYYPESVFVFSD